MSKKIVTIGNIKAGSDKLFLISGPSVIEDEIIMMKAAEKLKYVSERLDIPVVYKSSFMKDNRSSVNYYSGPGLDEGLRILQKVKEQFGFPLQTDIHYPGQAAPAAEVVDVLQIPAYLCMQTTLVVEAAKTGAVVNLEHGQFLAPQNMKKPAQKIESVGNANILLTELGYTFGYNDMVVDPRSFYEMGRTGYPIVFDVTHSIRNYGIPSADPNSGARQYLPVLGRAGVASGVDGIFVEVHPRPSEALCDAASQLDLNLLEEFLKPLIELHAVEVKYRNS